MPISLHSNGVKKYRRRITHKNQKLDHLHIVWAGNANAKLRQRKAFALLYDDYSAQIEALIPQMQPALALDHPTMQDLINCGPTVASAVIKGMELKAKMSKMLQNQANADKTYGANLIKEKPFDAN